MEGTIQWMEGHAGVLRVHEGTEDIPWPWSWVCTVDIIGDTAKLYGAVRAPTRQELKCIRRALAAAGVKVAEWERDKRDGVHMVTVQVSRNTL